MAEGGPMDPERKAGHLSARMVLTQEEGEEGEGTENERQGVEVIPEMQLSSKETDGGLPNVRSRRTASSTCRVEPEEAQDHVRESLAICQEEANETGFVPSALSEPRGAKHERRSAPRRVARIVRSTIHRTSVASFENSSFIWCFCGVLGPEQDLKRLPWLRLAYTAAASPMIR